MAVEFADLPQEVVILIASHLPQPSPYVNQSERNPSNLPAYATISRAWQYAIECRTFRYIELKSPDLQFFSRIMSKERRKILRLLRYYVVLPTYSDKRCAKFETEQDKTINNQIFTTAIKDLLGLLRSWHDQDQPSDSIDESLLLCLGQPYSPMDVGHRGYAKHEEDRFNWSLGRRCDLWAARYRSSILRLQGLENVQEVPQVSSFTCSSGARMIEPCSILLLASKFPNLECFHGTLSDNEKDCSLRQQMRHGQSSSILPRDPICKPSD